MYKNHSQVSSLCPPPTWLATLWSVLCTPNSGTSHSSGTPSGLAGSVSTPVRRGTSTMSTWRRTMGAPSTRWARVKLIILPGERNILKPFRVIITLCLCIMYYIHLMNRENIFLAMLHVIFSLMKPQQHRIFLIHLDFRPIICYHQELVRILDLKDFIWPR